MKGGTNMKRKYGNRKGWGRIVKQQYTQQEFQDATFRGHVTLMRFDEVIHPLWARYTNEAICLVENSSYMLQQFPNEANYSMTTFFSPKGELLQWYIDIIYATGLEEGVPYMDDLYLDLIVVPAGEVIEKDIDEMEQALAEGVVTQKQYDLAWRSFREVKEAIDAEDFLLFELSKKHFQLLKQDFPSK